MNLQTRKLRISYAEIVLIISAICAGGFNEYISCAVCALTSIFLIIKIAQQKSVKLRLNIVFIATVITTLWYLIACFYAIDSGMAFIGFLKFTPILLFLLLIFQNEDDRSQIIKRLPYYATAMGAVSLVLMYIPATKNYFQVEDRLAGFFQYPNTFAVFLLTGMLVLIAKEKYKYSDYILIAVLVTLILLTQSRTVFVLMILSSAVMLFCKKGRKIKIAVVACIVALIIIAIALYPLLKDHSFFSRFYSMSIFESTFAGRLLYYRDALPVILKNPFGLGYMGYYYIERSIQTGVYAIKYIHNDALQLLLDVGVVPFVLYLTAIVKSLISKKLSLYYKVILSTIFLHSLFDMDLQFSAMAFVMLLFTDIESSQQKVIKTGSATTILSAGIIGAVCIYFSFALYLEYYSYNEASDKLYHANTSNKIELLIQSDDIELQNQIADDILSSNEYVQIAYDAKVQYALAQGDMASVMEYKNKIFEIAPFDYYEYEEYCYILIQAVQAYEQYGDIESAQMCKEELINTKDRLESLTDRLSYFGKIIVDQPKTTLPDDILSYIDGN